MFDWFDDLDLDYTALSVAVLMALVMAFFWFTDPFGTGMDAVAWYLRIGGILLALPVGYVIALRMINR